MRIAFTALLAAFGVLAVLLCAVYLKFARRIDQRLAAGPFSDSINIYSAPRTLEVGDALTAPELVEALRRSGYTTARGNGVGWYNVRPGAVEIFPGRDSYLGGEPGVIEFSGGRISRIVSLSDNTARGEFQIEPQLLANVSQNREKRRLVHFADIPQVLVHAVISAEDKHFFHHTGFDLLRICKAAYVDMKEGRKEQGASTLSMQLARGLWLDPDKSWKRKAEELVITIHLEHRLTKQQIFEDYSNEVYLGRRGTFSIHGFGEGARAFFGKDISQLTLPQAALLAGLVQRPSYLNPFRYPDRARERRDIVLGMMRENGYISDDDYRAALAVPVTVTPEPAKGAAPYFLDFVNDEMQARLGDQQGSARYIYTTLDPRLQAAAEQAVQNGMDGVDRLLRRGKKHAGIPPGEPQVALIAIDPHSGEIKAFVGGRNYNASQLDHVLAMRQPGSVFKPFVYAAALNTGIEGGQQIFTPASILNDQPTTFHFGDIDYQPDNFRHEFMGQVTLRTALAHSLNVATVSLAQQVGYDNVVALAHRAGLNEEIKATPAVALGAYETTPLEIAEAYTIFANRGIRLTPSGISLVRGGDSTVLYQHEPDPVPVLDPRVAYLMDSRMEDVLRYGTGAAVRSMGFTLPAAGKTGTSHDGWFAGFTSQLECIVWVGFDDDRQLNLEGARSALPIWAEFMKQAAAFRQYRDARPFQEPAGITSVEICDESGQLATPYCPNTRSEVFIDGTEPAISCQLHGPAQLNYADRVVEVPPAAASAATTPPAAQNPATVRSGGAPNAAQNPATVRPAGPPNAAQNPAMAPAAGPGKAAAKPPAVPPVGH